MRPFDYARAEDIDQAVAAATSHPGATYVAGGTCLLDLMKLDVMTPARLVDVNRLPLAAIEPLPDGGVRIGATARNSDMAYSDLIRVPYPMLREAILQGASAQLRNAATLGGNIMQRTRCLYFRDVTTPCNKRRPGEGCSALDGFNRLNAVLGASAHCIAAHPSDMCVALAALDARINLRGPAGPRTVPFIDFHLLPGDHPERETVLQPGELIVSVDVPPLAFARRSTYLKVRDRASFAFALVSVAAALDISDGAIRGARIALGGVGTKPWRAHDAELLLVGRPPGERAYTDAATMALRSARGYRYNAFKIELAKRAIVRALSTVEAMA